MVPTDGHNPGTHTNIYNIGWYGNKEASPVEITLTGKLNSGLSHCYGAQYLDHGLPSWTMGPKIKLAGDIVP